MALLITPIYGTPDVWRKLFAAEMPELELRFWPDAGNPADIEAAAVAASMPHGKLKTFPNLRLIVSLLAGPEHLLHDPDVPDVPIVRAGSPDGDTMMNEVTLLHVLRHHRNLPAYALAQQRCEWISLPRLRARAQGRRHGSRRHRAGAARELAVIGFQVAGWVRSPRKFDGIEVFAGREQLAAFLQRSEILVNLLPLTSETPDILDAEAFAQMPKGSAVINLGRGPHVNEADLIAALDSDHLAAATLDVFPVEPLPKESPLWRHPKITIMPHASRRVDPRDGAAHCRCDPAVARRRAAGVCGRPQARLLKFERGKTRARA